MTIGKQRLLLIIATAATTAVIMHAFSLRLSRTIHDTTSLAQAPFALTLTCVRIDTNCVWADLRLCVSNTDERLSVTVPAVYQGLFDGPYDSGPFWHISFISARCIDDSLGSIFKRPRPLSVYGAYVTLPPRAWQTTDFRVFLSDVSNLKSELSTIMISLRLISPRIRVEGDDWSNHVWTGYREVSVHLADGEYSCSCD
jgi:hypothetical protein